MKKKLPPRQKETLDIVIRLSKKGYPPSIAEITEELNVASENATRNHLKALEKKGYLKRLNGLQRGLLVLP